MSPDRAWVRLASGRRINLLDPQPEDWTDSDLAIGLSRTYRWGGHSIWELPLSVAQHSLLVLRLCEHLNGRPLNRIAALRELLHDASEGLLSFDPISPVKPHLGERFKDLDHRLQAAIESRYELPRWQMEDYTTHKRADRLAAASEALHVAGWSASDITETLLMSEAPMLADPQPLPEGMKPWEPWPPKVAAGLFHAKLRELLVDQPSEMTPGDLQTAINREALHRRLAVVFHGMRDSSRRKCSAPPQGSSLHDTLVYAEAGNGSEGVEGIVVGGERDDTGAWDFDAAFRILTTDEELLVCHGFNCHVEQL